MNTIIKNKIGFFFLLSLQLFFITSCKKKDTTLPIQETSTVTDIDGNVYRTVKIGSQWWMAENLKVSKYNDGNLINKYQADTLWNKDTVGAYCVYDNSSVAPGLLYNWFAVNNAKKIAPIGWHIPSDEEWKILEQYLGMSQTETDKVNFRGSNEGDKLKKEGLGFWYQYPNVWATNTSGFSALGGACRMFNGIFGGTKEGLQYTGFWWSSTNHLNNNQAWYRYLDYKKSNVFRHYGEKTYGFSIRCVKD